MPENRFFDTNVLVYMASANEPKADRASELVGQTGFVSVQVLNEFSSVARRKLRWDWGDIREFVADVLVPVEACQVSLTTHNLGLSLAERHGLHIYDAMIVAAALEADCDTLYSEDMHAGLVVDDRLRIVNPFA